MYDENNRNNNQEFNPMNPEEHRNEEPYTTNFTMRDAEPERQQNASYSGQQSNGYGSYHSQDGYSKDPMRQSESQGPTGQNPHYQENPYRGPYNGNGNGNGSGNRDGGNYTPPQPRKEPGKKPGIAAKIAGVTAAALLFGVVSGGTIVGINWAADSYKTDKTVKVSQSETLAEAPAESNESSNPGVTVTQPVSLDVSAIVEKAMPSVVAITSTVVQQSNSWFGPSQVYEVPASGSGIIVGQNDSELLVVTNNHVVQDSKELKVTFIDNSSVDAAIKGTDSETDLAVIAIPLASIPSETMGQITIATLGDSDSLKVGQGVIAIGNALGYGQSVTVGYVSALDREVETDTDTVRNLLQTDAAINPGNSGGALLNMKGEVIGINSAKLSSTSVEGMGYAIPISQVQNIIGDLMNKQTRVLVEEGKQGYLGIQGKSVDETANQAFGMPRGVFVYGIIEGGAAANSDLHEKDIITKFDGQSVKSMEELQNMLTYYEGGTTVTLTVQSLDGGQYVERNVEIVLGNRPAPQQNQ